MAYTPTNIYSQDRLEGKPVVLAYSGGLDTSFCTAYFSRVCGAQVHALCVDTGGFSSEKKKQNEMRAKQFGAASYSLVDGRAALFEHYLKFLIFGNVLRGGTYPLCAGVERYVIAQVCADAAKKIAASGGMDMSGRAAGGGKASIGSAGPGGAVAIAHGSTGAGNDQIRMDAALGVLSPEAAVLAPIRDLAVSRQQELDWLASQKLPTDFLSGKYSINQGLWGVTIGGAETKGSMGLPPDSAYLWTKSISETPTEAKEIEIGFEKGIPVSLDGKKMDPVSLVTTLNELAGKFGVGRGVHLGDTILGIKGRVAFEAPAAMVLIGAHRELEKLVLTKQQATLKETVASTYGALMHEGLYFEPAMRDAEALLQSSQTRVSGVVKARLHKGNLLLVGSESPYSLLNPAVAVYGEDLGAWDGRDAAGFSKLWSMQSKLAAKAGRQADNSKNSAKGKKGASP